MLIERVNELVEHNPDAYRGCLKHGEDPDSGRTCPYPMNRLNTGCRLGSSPSGAMAMLLGVETLTMGVGSQPQSVGTCDLQYITRNAGNKATHQDAPIV